MVLEFPKPRVVISTTKHELYITALMTFALLMDQLQRARGCWR